MNLLQRASDAIDRAFDTASRWLAPAMPWLFLALRRALIAVLVAVIVALLFFAVPQSSEVLHGLGEPPLKSLNDFEANARFINFAGYLSYVATACALALATWYTARLLSTVDARLATPAALREGAGATGLARATTWLPRGLGVFVLGAAIGALLYAGYTPRLTQWQALALVALAVAGPLLLVAGLLARSRWASWLGAALMLVAAVLLVRFNNKWLIWLPSIVCATLPAALLWFLVKRRRLLEHLHRGQPGEADQPRDFGDVIVTLAIVVLVSAGALLLLALAPAAWVRLYGSAAAVLLFLAAAALLLTGLHIAFRHAARSVSGLSTAVLLLLALLVAQFGAESLGREELGPLAVAPPAPGPVQAPAPATPVRPFYVNAHGGGLRAAVFTAQLLARVDDASCGRFGDQVAAFSGVSGGSLGIATYLVARQQYLQDHGDKAWRGCVPGDPPTIRPLTDIVVQTLVQDHLSPAVARMLARDAPLWWSAPKRGQALMESWNSALVDALVDARPKPDAKAGQPPWPAPAGFALPLAALTGGMSQPLRVFFNATDADSGHIVWFSNRDSGTVGGSGGDATGAATAGLSVGQAVLHSARFPIVSPAGAYSAKRGSDAPGQPVATRRLVDGGYFDNSGSTTLLAVLRGDRARGASVAPRLLNIDGNPPEPPSACIDSDKNPPILTALRALLQVRSAHATLAVAQLEAQMGSPAPPLTLNLDIEQAIAASMGLSDEQKAKQLEDRESPLCRKVQRTRQAPLGWYISYDAARILTASVDRSAEAICAVLATPCRIRQVVQSPLAEVSAR